MRAGRVTLGFRIHWFVVPFRETTALAVPPVVAFFRVNVVPLTPVTGSLNVAVMFAVRLAVGRPGRGGLGRHGGAGAGEEAPARAWSAGCRRCPGWRWDHR